MSCRILYLMICGAGPAARIDVMVRLAQERGWSVHCIATPAAVEYFLDGEALASLPAPRSALITSGQANQGFRRLTV